MFKREHLRSVSVVFGIGEERAFYVEKTPSLLIERIRHNIVFFYLNYMVVTAILFCLTLLISPSAIIGIGLLALSWMWVIRASQSGSLRIGSKSYGAFTQFRAWCSILIERSLTNHLSVAITTDRRFHSTEDGDDWNGRSIRLCSIVFALEYLLVDALFFWLYPRRTRVFARRVDAQGLGRCSCHGRRPELGRRCSLFKRLNNIHVNRCGCLYA
jgi:hypothetical protein